MFRKLFTIFAHFSASEWLDESIATAQLTKQMH